jgi:hypothetical protein
MYVPFTILPEGLSLFYEGQPYTIAATHYKYAEILEAVKTYQYERLPLLLDLVRAVRDWFRDEPDFSVEGSLIVYQGVPFPVQCSEEALKMLEAGVLAAPMAKFLRKLRQNPVAGAQECLLSFCQANGILLAEDGDLIAFKGIRDDWTDARSGTVNNAVGAKPPRFAPWEVDQRRDIPCSVGYHVGSFSFAMGYGQRTVVVKIDPRDFMAIPYDNSAGKGRVCTYEVLSEVPRTAQPTQRVWTPVTSPCGACGQVECRCRNADVLDLDEEEDEEYAGTCSGCGRTDVGDFRYCPSCGDEVKLKW